MRFGLLLGATRGGLLRFSSNLAAIVAQVVVPWRYVDICGRFPPWKRDVGI